MIQQHNNYTSEVRSGKHLLYQSHSLNCKTNCGKGVGGAGEGALMISLKFI